MSRSVRSSPRSSSSPRAVEDRAGRLRVRRRGDVVGNRRPDRRRREPGAPHRVVQHADDPGRAFVARPLHAEPRREHLVGRGTGALDRTRVRRVAEQRAERDDHLAVRRAGDADDVVAERAPPQVRFDAEQQHEIASARATSRPRTRATASSPCGPRRRRARRSGARLGSRGTPRCRARRTAAALHARASQRTASDAASAASFQPENAAIIAGRRNDGSTLQRTVTRSP